MLPRGIRNNNPLNIRRGKDQWQGLRAQQNGLPKLLRHDARVGDEIKKVRKSLIDFRTLLVSGNDRSRSCYFRFWISRAGLYSGSMARIFSAYSFAPGTFLLM